MAKELIKSIAVSDNSNTARPRDPTLPIANSLEKVRGYKTLTTYRMQKSPYYYVRLFEDKKVLRKTEGRREGIKFAEKFFVEVKPNASILNHRLLN